MTKPAEKVLLAQQEALWNYLDALLQEIPEDLPEEPVAEAVATAEAEIQDWDPAVLAPAALLPEEVAQVEAEPVEVAPVEVAPVEVAPVEVEPAVVTAAAVVETVAPPPAAPAPAAEPAPELPPGWSKPDFQALLFKVGSLSLAVPLIKLHSVVPWPEEGVTPMPNQPEWCYGLLRYREQNVRVIDTEVLVIPADKRGEPMAPKHILIVGDGRWGLACSAIGQVVRLGPDEVKWRSGLGKRPWLQGTVLGHLCALLDTEAFAGMLQERGRRA